MRILIFVLSLFILIGCAENKQDTKEASNVVLEKINHNKISWRHIIVFQSSQDTMIMSFNKSGKTISISRSRDGYWYKRLGIFDEFGNEIESRSYEKWKKFYNSKEENLNNLSVINIKNEYDLGGKLKTQTSTDENGVLLDIWYFNYDSLSQVSSKTIIDREGNITDKYIYENEKIISSTEYDSDGKPTEQMKYEYDNAGKLLVKRGSSYSGWQETTYQYDDNDNEVVSIAKDKKGKTQSIDSTFYNSRGQKKYSLHYDDKGELSWKTTYEYFE